MNKGKVGWIFAWLEADSNAAVEYSGHCVRCTVVDCFNGEWRVTERFVKMPPTFTHEEYADMVYVYGYCNGNANAAVDEYRRRFRCAEHQTGLFLPTCFVHYVSVGHFLVYMCHQNADRYKQFRNRKKL